MFNKDSYFKTRADVEELLHDLNKCDDFAYIQVEDYPSDTFTTKSGVVHALFNVYVDDYHFKISRELKDFLVEKGILI